MKRLSERKGFWIALIIIAIVVILTISVLAYRGGRLPFGKKLDRDLCNRVNKSGLNSLRILFVGDSHTFYSASYANKLKNAYPSLQIKKLAANGRKTTTMLQTLRTELKKGKYDVISIMGGTNDVSVLPENADSSRLRPAKDALSEMYDLAHESGAVVVAISPPSARYYRGWGSGKKQLLQGLASWTKAQRTPDIFLDFYKMTDGSMSMFLADRLHPNGAAHKHLADSFAEEISRACK